MADAFDRQCGFWRRKTPGKGLPRAYRLFTHVGEYDGAGIMTGLKEQSSILGLVMFGRQQQKRSSPRVPSYGRAEILDLQGRPVQQCLIKEISQTGANIIPDDPKKLPDDCEIWIPHLNLALRAHVRWRRKKRAGLEFDKPVAALQHLEKNKGWETQT